MSIVTYAVACAFGTLGFFAVGERWQDRRDRRARLSVQQAIDLARDADAVFDGFVRAEIPHLYLAPPDNVIRAEHRFAARRAVAGGMDGGWAA